MFQHPFFRRSISRDLVCTVSFHSHSNQSSKPPFRISLAEISSKIFSISWGPLPGTVYCRWLGWFYKIPCRLQKLKPFESVLSGDPSEWPFSRGSKFFSEPPALCRGQLLLRSFSPAAYTLVICRRRFQQPCLYSPYPSRPASVSQCPRFAWNSFNENKLLLA